MAIINRAILARQRRSGCFEVPISLKKPLFICTLLLLTFGAALAFTLPSINYEKIDIDLLSGRLRRKTVIAGIVRQGFEETEASRWCRQYIGNATAPEWREVIYSGGSFISKFSAHSSYHSTINLLSSIVDELRKPIFTEEARRDSIRRFFKLLKEGESDRMAGEYVMDIRELVASRSHGPNITSEDLPKYED